MGIVGKGVFSIVIKCVDLKVKDGDAVAIKVIRNNDTMRKAAEKERAILCMIKDRDPENKRHCVRLLAHFEFRNHVALVFDYQQMNLRETLKKFGKDVGINIGAVRMYARQLLVALRHLADLKIVHADIKLDNILCSGDLKQVKLCDFGSAFRETDTDNDPTPYLVSRFYRAPEIILGLPCKILSVKSLLLSYSLILYLYYVQCTLFSLSCSPFPLPSVAADDRAIDLWSVAVCLYELFTGHVMFPGRTNNEMLRLNMAVKGQLLTNLTHSSSL
jgi:serine/threonine-protein kinase PRP4